MTDNLLELQDFYTQFADKLVIFDPLDRDIPSGANEN